MRSNCIPIVARSLFEPPKAVQELQREIQTEVLKRTRWDVPGYGSVVLDGFRDAGGALCSFLRLAPGAERTVRFVLDGAYGLESCYSGGWLLRPVAGDLPTYWVPRTPVFRSLDAQGRILTEQPASFRALEPTSVASTIELEARSDTYLDCTVWRFPAAAAEFVAALDRSLVLERQPIFMLSSHTAFRGPADLYAYLVHGQVYENRFDFLRKRKICSELEAYSLYLALHGLETATGKKLYRLLKQQIVHSVIARQAPDGAWHHGEWTDFIESHYRFHNAAMLLLEAAFEEAPGVALGDALNKAATVLSENADRTDIGLWFFHDSLEQSVEMTDKSGIRWIPSRELGKSPGDQDDPEYAPGRHRHPGPLPGGQRQTANTPSAWRPHCPRPGRCLRFVRPNGCIARSTGRSG